MSLKAFIPENQRLWLKLWSRRARMTRKFGPLFFFHGVGVVDAAGVRFRMHTGKSAHYLFKSFIGKPYEPRTCQHMVDHFKGRPVKFFDIGSENGFFSALFSVLTPGNEVYAFDPFPTSCKLTARNVRLNEGQAKVYQIGLSNANGTAQFGKIAFHRPGDKNSLTVPAQRFDDWVEEHGVWPDLMKIDTHGSEGRILAGMPKTLMVHRFPIYLELHDEPRIVDYTIAEVVDMVLDGGYRIYEIARHREAPKAGAELAAPVEGDDLNRLRDFSRWTKTERFRCRMLYCEKEEH